MKIKLIPILFLLFFNVTSAQELEKEHQAVVSTFINYVKTKNTEALSKLVSYPLRRAYPLRPINDEMQFIARYDEMFDESLIKEIVNSKVNKDWAVIGWRGIMLNSGSIWLGQDGQLLSVIYQSDAERVKQQELIAEDKASIHQSLVDFKRPTLILVTKKFKIRIDELDDGTYRYASWSINSPMSKKPDLVIKNGVEVFDGSGGNHHYEFTNGHYKYVCYINRLREDNAPPANLVIYKNDKKILSKAAELK